MKLSAPIYQLKRRAKLMARDEKIPLHTALDRIARDEGFAGWSLLSARVATSCNGERTYCPGFPMAICCCWERGPVMARPCSGFSSCSMPSVTAGEVSSSLSNIPSRKPRRASGRWKANRRASVTTLEIVTSDEICADYIMRHLADASPGNGRRYRLPANPRSAEKQARTFRANTTLQNFARKTGDHSRLHLPD